MLGLLATKKLLISLSILSVTVGAYSKFEADVDNYNDERDAQLHYFKKKANDLQLDSLLNAERIDALEFAFMAIADTNNNLRIDNKVLKNSNLINAGRIEELSKKVEEQALVINTLKNQNVYSYPDSIHNLLLYGGKRPVLNGEEIFIKDTNRRVFQNKSIIVPIKREIKVKNDTIR